jgi:hypothetical protein
VKANAYNSTTSSNYQIAWTLKPQVDAQTNDGVAGEAGSDSGIISIGRNGPVTSPLTVNFTVGGTATRGTDYDLYYQGILVAGNSVTLGNLAATADLEVRPVNDHVAEPTETVTVTLASNSAYVIGSGTNGSVNITDAGPALAQTTQIWQTSPHKLIFAIDRADPASLALSDIVVTNLDTNLPVTPQGLNAASSAGGATATLTFNGVLPDGHYRATILAGSVSSAAGDANFADMPTNFFVLTADANHDGHVDLLDFNILSQNFGQTGRDGSTGDFDYDGDCDLADFNILSAKFGANTGPSLRLAPSNPFSSTKRIGDTTRDLLDQLA